MKARPRYAIESVSRRRGCRIAWVRDRVHNRTFGVYLQGTRLVLWDRNYERPKQPVQNPTLRKIAMEVLG